MKKRKQKCPLTPLFPVEQGMCNRKIREKSIESIRKENNIQEKTKTYGNKHKFIK